MAALRFFTTYSDGVEVGPRIAFDPDGRTIRETNYNAKGQLHGRMLSRDPAEKSGVYYQGKKIGSWSNKLDAIVARNNVWYQHHADFYPFGDDDVVVHDIFGQEEMDRLQP